MEHALEELTCGICKRVYSKEPDLIPRLLPETGVTFCNKCLNELLLKDPEAPFMCPVEG